MQSQLSNATFCRKTCRKLFAKSRTVGGNQGADFTCLWIEQSACRKTVELLVHVFGANEKTISFNPFTYPTPETPTVYKQPLNNWTLMNFDSQSYTSSFITSQNNQATQMKAPACKGKLGKVYWHYRWVQCNICSSKFVHQTRHSATELFRIYKIRF